MSARASLAAVLLMALAPAPGRAQATPKRGGGFWVDAGVGYGRLHLTCTTCSGLVIAGGRAVTISAGFTPAQNVLLGLQVQQWSSSGGLGQEESSILAVVQWYPWPATGLFLRAGNGIVRGPLANPAAAIPASTEGTGVGFALGLGYDLKLNHRLGVTVQVATHISALGDLVIDGQPAKGVIAYVTRLGVAVVLR